MNTTNATKFSLFPLHFSLFFCHNNPMIFIKLIKEKWMWLVYAAMFGALVGGRIFVFVSPSEQTYLYYKIMLIMSINQGHFPAVYVLSIASLILNTAAFIFLWFYVFDSKKFSFHFILLLLIARVYCDFLGHSYEFNTIKSLYYQSETAARIAGANLFFWILPSYLAMGDYIIKKIKQKNS